MSLRSNLYRSASLMGDANAVLRGPGAVLRRICRKVIWRALGGLIGRWLR